MSSRRVPAIVAVVVLAAVGWFGWQWWTHRVVTEDPSFQPGYVERVPMEYLVTTGDYDLREAEFNSFQAPDRFTFTFRARIEEDDGSIVLVTDAHTGIVADDTVTVDQAFPDAPLDTAASLGGLTPGRRIFVGIQKSQLGEPAMHVYRIVITPEQVY